MLKQRLLLGLVLLCVIGIGAHANARPVPPEQELPARETDMAAVAAVQSDLSLLQTKEEVNEYMDNVSGEIKSSLANLMETDRASLTPATRQYLANHMAELRRNPAVVIMRKEFAATRIADIIAIQHVQPIGNGPEKINDLEMIVTTHGNYFVDTTEKKAYRDSAPQLEWSRQALFTGVGIERFNANECSLRDELVVTFYMPVCFREISPGVFDGIVDAWAYIAPACRYPWCWVCSGGQCGIAWPGSGTTYWRNYNDCQPLNGNRSVKIGKMVQKRWYYPLKCEGFSNSTMAKLVTVLVRW